MLVDNSVSLVSLEAEMKSAYLDYAMSVIVSRAIPDLRDGLKPVHRRILYSMNETNNTFDRPYRKSARPVGDVMGKYHPHGDQAIYDALVRMAQDFSMSLTLLDGQGNFGSIDGDSAAAMRYTEVRMAKPSTSLLDDIEKGTVDFQDNYDGKDVEPRVLPARFPNLLVNGAGGIAVGMATNIPPHNIGEVIDATLAVIEDPKIEIEELMKLLPAPDFPTGGIILGQSGSRQAYLTGKGSIVIRAKYTVEEQKKERFSIVITEIPYQVNKSSLVEKIAELAREKKIEGISHVQDESDRLGVRVVIDLKRDATIEVVLNQLYRFSQMQTSFGFNLLALDKGKPILLDLKTFLNKFIEFREEVVAKRTIFELEKARERSHLLCGLAVAVSNVDKIITIIRNSENPSTAKEALMNSKWKVKELSRYLELIDDPLHKIKEDGTYLLSEQQAKAILELRLQRLTALGSTEIGTELQELSDKIKLCLDILKSRERIRAIISSELLEVRESYNVPRRSEIQEFEGDFEDEDLIEKEEMVVTVTREGYIKRTALSEYREQKRGGKGTQGMNTKETDVVTNLFVTNTHTPLLFFSSDGFVYKLKTWRLPQSGRNSKGKAIVNLLPINSLARITTILP
ncbi:DNA gyrase subunit A, partial [Paracoccaceae bacterium]|nr:DNA gyrase subunit A [Paracoccaceae bacterium]